MGGLSRGNLGFCRLKLCRDLTSNETLLGTQLVLLGFDACDLCFQALQFL